MYLIFWGRGLFVGVFLFVDIKLYDFMKNISMLYIIFRLGLEIARWCWWICDKEIKLEYGDLV